MALPRTLARTGLLGAALGLLLSPAASLPAGAVTSAATPVLSPSGGTFQGSVLVSIADDTPGATIYYTLDDTVPTTSSPVYTGPVTISSNVNTVSNYTALRASAIAPGLALSGNARGVYTISTPTPTISPNGGSQVGSPFNVSISDTDPSATIYYTTDGSAVTTSSNVYTGSFQVNQDELVQARALSTGKILSGNSAAQFLVYFPAPVISPNGGSFVDSTSVTLTDAYASASIYYTTDGSAPWVSGPSAAPGATLYTGPFTVSSSQTVNAVAIQVGWGTSAISSATFTQQTASPVISPAAGNYIASVNVTISDPDGGAAIHYTTDGTDPRSSATAQLYSGPISVTSNSTVTAYAHIDSLLDSDLSSAAYTITPLVSDPLITGTSPFSNSTTVTISDSTPGSTIYYTTDGSTPTTSSAVYSSPISISATTTVKAIAAETGYASSSVVSGTFTRTGAVATPTISPTSGVVNGTKPVTITTTTAGATIHYRITTSTAGVGAWQTGPAGTSTVTFTVNVNTTTQQVSVEAYATESGLSDSATASVTYTH